MAKIIAPLLVLAAAIFSLWEVIQNPFDSLVNAGDDFILTWILSENIQKIPFDLPNIFQGNIFFPYKDVLAYSSLMVPSSFIAYLPNLIFGNPLLVFNFTLVSGQIFTMLSVYFLFKLITRHEWASAVGSIAFGLSKIRMGYFAHLHVWNMHWWIIALIFFIMFFRTKKPKYIYFFALFEAIHVWENMPEVYFGIIVAFVYALFHWEVVRQNLKLFLKPGLLFILLTLPVAVLYINFFRDFHYIRSIRETAHFSISLNDYWGVHYSPGLIALFIIALFLIFLHSRRVKVKSYELKWMFASAIVSFVLSLGPVLKIGGHTFKFLGGLFIPLPYILFYYLLPGFQAMRTPERWGQVMALMMSGVIAYSVSGFTGKYKSLLILLCLAVAVVGGTKVKYVFKIPTVNQYSEVYKWLKLSDVKNIVELPIYTWGDQHGGYQKEMYRMLYSLDHRKNIVNGASGFFPPKWELMIAELQKEFPSDKVVSELKELGVQAVIIHKNEFDGESFIRIKQWGEGRLLWSDYRDSVYKL